MYDSSFSISVPAPSRSLVSLDDVDAALGTQFSADLPYLDATILQVSDLISQECRVPRAGATPPTLRQETVVETFRLYGPVVNPTSVLFLRRVPVVLIASVVVDGVSLTAGEYRVDESEGALFRLDDDGYDTPWTGRKIVVTYTAGWATVPEALKLATIRAVQEQVSASARDPLLRSEVVEGIGRLDYWVNQSPGGSTSQAVSGVVAAMLDPFRYCNP